MAATAKVILIEGNPKKKPESAEHIIKFPGGSISVCRTSDNEYWAHIEVHRGRLTDDSHRESAVGEICDSRLDYGFPKPHIEEIPNTDRLEHIAVRIRTKREA